MLQSPKSQNAQAKLEIELSAEIMLFCRSQFCQFLPKTEKAHKWNKFELRNILSSKYQIRP